MSLLTIVQKAVKRIGVAEPSFVVGNADEQVVQLLNLANEEGEELAERYRWQVLIKEATFSTSATASQGSLTSIATEWGDGAFILNDTIWNRTVRRPVLGPLAPRDWQTLQASPVTGPFDQYRIRGNAILFDPVPTAGETCAFEYKSPDWCESSGGTAQDAWAADTDVGRLSEKLMIMGLIWRWKQYKGFAYAEDFNKYERRVEDAMARDATKATTYLDGGITDFQPGIFVPQTGFGS